MKITLALAAMALPALCNALAVGVGRAQDAPGNNLEARNPIYPTKVTVRALPAYPTKVTVRAKREVETTAPAGDVDDNDHNVKRRAPRPPKITLKTVKAKRDVGQCRNKPTKTTEPEKPYETVICRMCPEGKVCPAVCIPITTTITPVPEPSTTVICEPCPPDVEFCPAICKLTTVTIKPEPTATTDCCPPGAQCFAPCSLPTPRETA